MPKKKCILWFLGCNMVELICICQNISKWESYSYYLSPKLLLSYSNMLFWLRVKSNFLHTLNPLVRMHYREWLRYSSILKARKRSGLWKVKCYILVLLWMPLISNFDDKRSKKTSKKWKLWHKNCVHIFSNFLKEKSVIKIIWKIVLQFLRCQKNLKRWIEFLSYFSLFKVIQHKDAHGKIELVSWKSFCKYLYQNYMFNSSKYSRSTGWNYLKSNRIY